MRNRAIQALPWAALGVSIAAGVLLISGGEEDSPVPAFRREAAGESEEPGSTGPEPVPAGQPVDPVDAEAPDSDQRQPDRRLAAAERAYRFYIEAINTRDGVVLFALLGPGGVEALELPARRGTPGERLSESIGYEDPRGFPVWAGTTLASVDSAEELPSGAIQVTATIVTDFADRPEPSVETDVAYLDSDGTLLKPSAAIYRAVGKPDVPPSVIAAP